MRLAAAGFTAVLTAAVSTGAWIAAAPAISAPAAEPPLIPRASFFGNPTKTAGRISPDGKWLSWIAPRDGVLNIWVAPTSDPSAAKPLTAEKNRPIRQYFWAADSSGILFINDKGGDENFLLYSVDTNGAQKALTPFENTRVYVMGVSDDRPDTVLVGVNNRDPKWHDAYEVNIKTGAMKEVFRNDGYSGFVTDEQLNLRIAGKTNDDGSTDYYKVVNGKAETKPFAQVSFEDSDGTTPMGFTRDGKTLYWTDTRGRDKAAVVAQDWASGKTTIIGQSDKADAAPALFNPTTGKLEAYSVNYLRNEWIATDPSVKADIDFLEAELKGDIGVAARTTADDRWVVWVDPVTAPASTWLYERKTRKLTKLYVSRPELEGAPLAAQYPVEIATRDGKTLVSYLTLPKGSDPDGDGRPDKAVPLVLFVHGGPWARDQYGYNGWHQWLSNRGYAVLSVNYRGSTGFGKSFTRSSDGEWAGKMA